MSEHPGLDKIVFTGSIQTDRRVMASAAANLKRLTLELGGTDAAIGLVDEEPFGPVLPVLSYDGLDEVVKRARASIGWALPCGGRIRIWRQKSQIAYVQAWCG